MQKISNETYEKFKDKKNRDNKEKLISNVVILLVILLILIGIISIVIITKRTKNKLKNSTSSQPEYADQMDQKKYDDTVEHVRDKGEMNRFKVYLGDIFDNIEKKNYDEIYARLDDGYKEGFFPKQKILEDYLEGEFPKNPGYVIKNFERIGTLYVYVIDIVSVSDSKKKTDMRFVFEEEDLNDYRFSFSKK